MIGTPYIVIYRIEASAIVVLRVLHTAQRWPAAAAVAIEGADMVERDGFFYLFLAFDRCCAVFCR